MTSKIPWLAGLLVTVLGCAGTETAEVPAELASDTPALESKVRAWIERQRTDNPATS